MLNQPAAPPAAPTSSTRITEICIGSPDEYDGKAETAQAWMDSIRLYLLINHTLYYDDDRKIAFTLSYMKKGAAATWAEVRHQLLRLLQFTFPLLSRIHSASLVLSLPSLNPPHHLVTSSSCHHITMSPCHLITLSPCHLITVSLRHLITHHLDISLTLHSIALDLTLPSTLPCLDLILVLASSSPRPHLISYLCTPLSIPFLGPCILPTLIPVPLISFINLVYHLYSSFHLHPSSRPLVSPFVLFSTCSLLS